MKEQKPKMNVRDMIEKIILEKLNDNKLFWTEPAYYLRKCNLISGKPYRGINRILLAFVNETFFITFKQARDHKLKIKKGSRTIPIVYWVWEKKVKEHDVETGEEIEVIRKLERPICLYYKVFPVSCVEDCPAKQKLIDKRLMHNGNGKKKDCETYVKNTKVKIVNIDYSGSYYDPIKDTVNLPDIGQFKSTPRYYHTLFHELIHWTGHKTRLDRSLEEYVLDNSVRSQEELTAEIGAAVLSANFEMPQNDISAAYIKSWLDYLKGHADQIWTAATKSEKAIKFIDGLQPEAKNE